MLSILVPVNQHTKYFCAVVKSIEKSISLLNFPTQLVIILNRLDSVSRKNIENELDSYSYPYEIAISNAKNLSDVLNFGLELCIYDYVARMDQDDVTFADRFDEQFSFLEKNPKVALVGGQVILINSVDEVIGKAKYPVESKNIRKSLKYMNCFAHPAVMYRKSAVVKAGGYLNTFPLAEDYYLWVRLSKIADTYNLKSHVLKYRIHDSQVSADNFFEQLSSTIRIMGIGFNILDQELTNDFRSIRDRHKKTIIREVMAFTSVRQDRKFRAAIALMFLRRGSSYTGNTLLQNILLIWIALFSDPLMTFKSVLDFLK